MRFMRHDFAVIIPAYNEEKTIGGCIEAVFKAASEALRSGYILNAVHICINGCTDNTVSIVEAAAKKNPKINIIKLEKKGYRHALNALITTVNQNDQGKIIKIDADCRPMPDAFTIMLRQLDADSQLAIVGGHPLPMMPNSRWKRVLTHVFHCRAMFPMSEVSVQPVEHLHDFHELYFDEIFHEWEKRSKIYFHGRIWCARSCANLLLPEQAIGDDTWICAGQYTASRTTVIRVRYDAICEFAPYYSFTHHWKAYLRVSSDLKCMLRCNEFAHYVHLSRTKFDWRYILSLSFYWRMIFILYAALNFIEQLSYRFVQYSDAHWTYSSKKCAS